MMLNSDFTFRLVETISFIAPVKRIKVKVSSKPRIDNEIILVIQRRNKLSNSFNGLVLKLTGATLSCKNRKLYLREKNLPRRRAN